MEMAETIAVVNKTKNKLRNRSGYSPKQWVFGGNGREELYGQDNEEAVATRSAASPDTGHQVRSSPSSSSGRAAPVRTPTLWSTPLEEEVYMAARQVSESEAAGKAAKGERIYRGRNTSTTRR